MTSSENITVLRLIGGRLAACAPGSEEQPRWLDEENALPAFATASSQRRESVIFAAPGEDVRLQRLTISPEEKKHLAKSLPYMLEEQLAGDVEQLHFASTVLKELDYAVAICAASKMRHWQTLLADFDGGGLWTSETLLLPWREGEWCLLFEADKVVLRTGACEGISAERELLSVLLTAALVDDPPPRALVVYGSEQAGELTEIPESLRALVQWRKGNFCSALLLADTVNVKPNLLQGEFSLRLPLSRWWQQWRLVAAVLLAAFGLQLLTTWVDYRQLKQENESLQTAVMASYRQAYPKGNAPDPEVQLRRQLASLQGSAQSSGFVNLMAKVGSVIAGLEGTSIASINYSDRGGELRMNIVAADYTAVEKIREGINKTGLKAVMESSSAQGDRVRARIRVGGPS
ncbi:MAG: type II secretion system protein GspL [Halioglobus sp.]